MKPSPADIGKSLAATVALVIGYLALRLGLHLTPTEDATLAGGLIAFAGTLIHSILSSKAGNATADYLRGHSDAIAKSVGIIRAQIPVAPPSAEMSLVTVAGMVTRASSAAPPNTGNMLTPGTMEGETR